MGVLTAKQRNKLKPSQFGDPKNRRYPLENPAHDRNAKARASEMEHKGAITKRKEETIDARADRALARQTGKKAPPKKKVTEKKKSPSKKKASKRGR